MFVRQIMLIYVNPFARNNINLYFCSVVVEYNTTTKMPYNIKTLNIRTIIL